MIDYKPIRQDEDLLRQAKLIWAEKYPEYPEPDWPSVFVRTEDGKVRGMIGYQYRVLVSLLDADEPLIASEMIARADQQLSDWGVRWYEFSTDSQNERMQRCLEKHYGLEPFGEFSVDGRKSKVYMVKKD